MNGEACYPTNSEFSPNPKPQIGQSKPNVRRLLEITTWCEDGFCAYSCPEGQTYCQTTQGDPTTGLCAETSADSSHCGVCNVQCPAGGWSQLLLPLIVNAVSLMLSELRPSSSNTASYTHSH